MVGANWRVLRVTFRVVEMAVVVVEPVDVRATCVLFTHGRKLVEGRLVRKLLAAAEHLGHVVQVVTVSVEIRSVGYEIGRS